MEMERAGARRSYINASRKKSIRKKKRAYQPAIEKAVYGRDTISKMRNVVDYNTVSTRADNIIPLVSVLQTCPDWGNFSTSFQQYNLLKVSMKIFVGNTTAGTSAGPNNGIFSASPLGAIPATSYDSINTQYSNCSLVPKCGARINQDSEPILVGLPYNAQYYQPVGICEDGCLAKPSGPIILDQYASDGSGYTVGPWTFTGAECVPGVTPNPPTQPPQPDKCDALRNACEAKCDGRAYSFELV